MLVRGRTEECQQTMSLASGFWLINEPASALHLSIFGEVGDGFPRQRLEHDKTGGASTFKFGFKE